MRAQVVLDFPELSSHPDVLATVCGDLALRFKTTESGQIIVWNMETLGKSEGSLLQCVIDGAAQLIKIEKSLQAGDEAVRMPQAVVKGLTSTAPENNADTMLPVAWHNLGVQLEFLERLDEAVE